MYQSTTIIGHVGRDPIERLTSDGQNVCSFSVAVNKKWTDRETGQKREKTTWFQVSTWRGLADTCRQYVHKGMAVMVVGEIEAGAFLDRQTGNPRASLNLTARDVRFLSGRDESSPVEEYDLAEAVDDIPF